MTFIQKLQKRFYAGNDFIDVIFLFNGYDIEQEEIGLIRKSMNEYMSQVEERIQSKHKKRKKIKQQLSAKFQTSEASSERFYGPGRVYFRRYHTQG